MKLNNYIYNNPGLRVEYYSDIGSRNFIKNNYNSEVLWAYDMLIPGAYKADLFRYCILYKRGGIYSDLSQIFRVPLDNIIDFKNDHLVLVKDTPQYVLRNKHLINENTTQGVQISFIASRPNNPIFMDAINKIISNCKERYMGFNPLSPTGPELFYQVLKSYDGPYRMDLHLNLGKAGHLFEDGPRIIDKNGLVVIINKSDFHNDLFNDKQNIPLIKPNRRRHYSELWKSNIVYRSLD